MHCNLWTFLWSRKLATILLFFLILLSVIGATVPQISGYPAAEFLHWQQDNPLLARLAIKLKLTNLLESSLFIGCSLMLCLSLLLCSIRRTFQLVSGCEERNAIDELNHAPQNSATVKSFVSTDQLLTKIIPLLEKKRFCCTYIDSGSMFAVRGRWGAFGSTLFHFSFLILLVGVVASTWARFEGVFSLTEGQSFRGLPREYAFASHAPLISRDMLPFQLNFEELIRVDDIAPHYRNRVSLQEESGERFDAIIRPFHALNYRGYTFYQKDHGFSPSIIFTDKQGKVLFDAFVSLNTKRQGDITYEDYFKVPGTMMYTQLTLYPDADTVEENLVNRSEFAVNPILAIKLWVDDKVFFRGTVKRGETIDSGNFTIEFKEVRYWSSFRVVKDSGLPFIYGSFVVGILGYFLRLFFVREVLKVSVNQDISGSTVVVTGSTEQNEALFAEKFKDIVNTLRRGVAEV